MATLGGLTIGIFGAAIRSGRATWFSRIWGGYVEIIRNTPFVVQLFFIVFGRPKTIKNSCTTNGVLRIIST